MFKFKLKLTPHIALIPVVCWQKKNVDILKTPFCNSVVNFYCPNCKEKWNKNYGFNQRFIKRGLPLCCCVVCFSCNFRVTWPHDSPSHNPFEYIVVVVIFYFSFIFCHALLWVNFLWSTAKTLVNWNKFSLIYIQTYCSSNTGTLSSMPCIAIGNRKNDRGGNISINYKLFFKS